MTNIKIRFKALPRVRKNCDPSMPSPQLTMESNPFLVCLIRGIVSASKYLKKKKKHLQDKIKSISLWHLLSIYLKWYICSKNANLTYLRFNFTKIFTWLVAHKSHQTQTLPPSQFQSGHPTER